MDEANYLSIYLQPYFEKLALLGGRNQWQVPLRGIQQVKNGKNSGDVCIRFVIKKYIIPTLKSFIPSFFLLAVFVARGNAQSIEDFQTSRMSSNILRGYRSTLLKFLLCQNFQRIPEIQIS